MRLFVTGGAGFIGSAYVRHVLETTDDEVTVYDALTYAGTMAGLDPVKDNPRYRFVRGDICDLEPLEETMRGHDVVVHFAAETHVDRSIAGPQEFVSTNCYGTALVLHAARRVGVERLLHVSTDEVYGEVEVGSFHEDDRLQPRSPYSASKASSDLLALSYQVTYDLPVLVTRSSNNFGPYQFPEKLIPLFVTHILQGRKVPLYGDGLNVRDWCYVDDNCLAIDAVLRDGIAGEIYNIAAGNEMTNREITGHLLDLLGVDESVVEHVEDRRGHDRRYSVDTTKIRSLGWKPERDFHDELASTVEWYRGNRDWWEPLKAAT